MNSRFRKLTVESLEGRSVLSTTAFAYLNGDDVLDKVALTAPKTITVSLSQPDGSLAVSATLTSPKPVDAVGAFDFDSDGDLDIYASGSKPSGDFYSFYWQNDGDGNFNYVEPFRWKHSKWFV